MNEPDEFAAVRADLLSNLEALHRVVAATTTLLTILDDAWFDPVRDEIKATFTASSHDDGSELSSTRFLPSVTGRLVREGTAARVRGSTGSNRAMSAAAYRSREPAAVCIKEEEAPCTLA